MKKILTFSTFILLTVAFSINAQVRPTDVEATDPPVQKQMLESFNVRYMGGLFGFSKKENGTVAFDNINERLIFKGKANKERFSIPYSAILVVFPSQTKVRSTTGKVVSAIPIAGAGIAGMFMKKKKNYLVLRFDDTDVKAQGTINFQVDSAELLTNSIYSIGEKAEMKRRGDAYMRASDY